jgi:hypothetical protein
VLSLLEAFKVFKVQREKVVGAKHTQDTTHTAHRLRERKRVLTKKTLGLVWLRVLALFFMGLFVSPAVIAEFIRVSLYMPSIKARARNFDRPQCRICAWRYAEIWWL